MCTRPAWTGKLSKLTSFRRKKSFKILHLSLVLPAEDCTKMRVNEHWKGAFSPWSTSCFPQTSTTLLFIGSDQWHSSETVMDQKLDSLMAWPKSQINVYLWIQLCFIWRGGPFITICNFVSFLQDPLKRWCPVLVNFVFRQSTEAMIGDIGCWRQSMSVENSSRGHHSIFLLPN